MGVSKESTHRDQGMKRRDFLRWGAAGAAAAALGPLGQAGVAGAPKGTQRPNIIFAFSDEHRWCSMPFTEMPEVVAPNMERMLREGTSVDNCVSTSPICVPFRGMLMTGMWPHQSSIISNEYFGNTDVIGLEAPTIAHIFKEAGYATGYVGKWHLKNDTCANAGFDYFKHWLWGDNHWETQVRDIPGGEDFHTEEGYNAIGMTDQALEFIRGCAGGEQPFLMMLSWNPPHWRWYDAPEEFVKLYPQDEIPFRPNVTEERYKQGSQLTHYRHYHAHISAVDVQLGRLIDALDELGIADNTVLIYSSDHGSSFGSNSVGSKANPYDESIRVPFLVRWPGQVPAGQRSDRMIGTIDLFPTLCGLAGLQAPKHCGGLDFSGVLLGGDGPDPESQLILVNNVRRNYYRTVVDPGARNHFYPFRGVRTKRYSYVFNADGEWLLFDNQKDPYQLNNLANDPAHADLRADLRARLDRWMAQAEDPFIPEEWSALSLPDRIHAQNRYYTVMRAKGQWDRYKEDILRKHVAMPVSATKMALIRQACDGVYDIEFFGQYKGLDQEIASRKEAGEELGDLPVRLSELEREHLDRFNSEVQRITSADEQ
jgi:arylsulfatase A-like enzyme